jgi:mitogen-activated protein kinase organizer 1
VLDADCSTDHSFICTASADKTIMYIDVKTAKILRKYRAHIGKCNNVITLIDSFAYFIFIKGRVNCARFNQDESNLIISGSIDGKVRIWDLRSKSYEHLQEIDDCKDSVTYIDLNAQQILISCLDKYVRLYDIRFGKMQCDFIDEQV